MATKREDFMKDIAESSGINALMSADSESSSGYSEFNSDAKTTLSDASIDVNNLDASVKDVINAEISSPKKGRPREYRNRQGELVNRTEKITIYLTREQADKVDYIARWEGVSKSRLLTDIIAGAIETKEYRNKYKAMADALVQSE